MEHLSAQISGQQQPAKAYRFTFAGENLRYLRIFHSNLLLCLLTFGIYSPWAKVRNRKYIFNSISLAGCSFDYDASPKGILISRLLLLLFFAVVAGVEIFLESTPGKHGSAYLVPLIMLPLFAIGGRAFNARHTVFCGIRFGYEYEIFRSHLLFFLLFAPSLIALALLILRLANHIYDDLEALLGGSPSWLLSLTLNYGEDLGEGIKYLFILFLFIAWPLHHWWWHRIKIDQLSFGRTEFRFTATFGSYASVYFGHLLLAFLVVVMLLLTAVFGKHLPETPRQIIVPTVFFCSPFLIYLLAISYVAIQLRNFWSSIATNEKSHLIADFHPFAYALRISLLNHLLILLSLGALLPIARIRRWRYLADHLYLLPSDKLLDSTQSGGAGNLQFSKLASRASPDKESRLNFDLGFI